MNIYFKSGLNEREMQLLLQRPKMDFKSIFSKVEPIIEQVRTHGDAALRELTLTFDKAEIEVPGVDPASLPAEINEEVKEAIDLAFNNISRFHEAQKVPSLRMETMPGVTCMKVSRPVEKVGLYVPGGTAVLPSTALMLAVPAMIAGCRTKVLATPPGKDGTIAPELVYIAQKAGVDVILKAGGAQAVAAMAFGTESVPKADKIFGPGNQYVTGAKMILQNGEAQISIDMPAGPSEVLVIADENAKVPYVAADLLSQAEHGSDSQVVAVLTEEADREALIREVEVQLDGLPRKEIASKALENSFILVVKDLEEAFAFSNQYAPEHLIVNTAEAEQYMDSIEHAGSVFLGPLTPESVGDYASGTNHTLPTYGYARMYSGVNLSSFQKSVTMQSLTEEGLKNIGPAVEVLAGLEQLQAHRNAVSLRLKDLKSGDD